MTSIFIKRQFGEFVARYYPAINDTEAFLDVEVPSSDPNADPYSVIVEESGRLECSCKGWQYRGSCRHLKEVQKVILEKQVQDVN